MLELRGEGASLRDVGSWWRSQQKWSLTCCAVLGLRAAGRAQEGRELWKHLKALVAPCWYGGASVVSACGLATLCSLLGISDGVPLSSAASLSAQVSLYVQWLCRERISVRVFTIPWCVSREPAGRVEEFKGLKKARAQRGTSLSPSAQRKGTGVRAGTSSRCYLRSCWGWSKRKGRSSLQCRPAGQARHCC